MKHEKIYNAYKKKADFLLNFQLCRAYIDENCGVSRVVESILMRKFRNQLIGNDRDMTRFLNAIRATQGKRDAVINLPYLDFKDTVANILAKFVEEKFDKMVESVKITLGKYPLKFRDLVEQESIAMFKRLIYI